MKHLITYDLYDPGQNYEKLISAIKSLGTAKRISGSCWAVKTHLSSGQICTCLASTLDQNDLLFVCPFGSYAAINCKQETLAWLNN